MARIIDVSLGVHPEMVVWPADPPVRVERTRLLERDGANVSEIALGSHTGTHVDPPLHFIDGAAAADALDLDALVGRAWVADLRGATGELSAEQLEAAVPEGARRVLLRTDNSALWESPAPAFPDVYVSVSLDAARMLRARGVRLIGVDFLSVEKRGSPGHPVHVALLEAGIVILEGLDLSRVEQGWYTLACLPLKVVGGDGAPARAVLIDDQV